MLALYFWIFILGAVIGSFLNVVVLRVEGNMTLRGRSACPRCAQALKWYELVPLVSYGIQRGRCRSCHGRISWQYPLVELTTGLIFVLTASLALPASLTSVTTLPMHAWFVLLLHMAVWATLIVITVYDLRTKLIPDIFSYTFMGLALALYALLVVSGVQAFSWWWLAAGPLFYLPYWLLWRVSNGGWIGLGDAKLSWGIGWYLGPLYGGAAILLAFWIGALVSLGLMGVQRLQHRDAQNSDTRAPNLTLKSEVPFGPYLVLGIALAHFLDISIGTLMFL